MPAAESDLVGTQPAVSSNEKLTAVSDRLATAAQESDKGAIGALRFSNDDVVCFVQIVA